MDKHGPITLNICLFVLRLNIKVNNFSVMSGRSYYQYLRGVECLAQGHNMAEVGFEPLTSCSEYDAVPLSHRTPNQNICLDRQMVVVQFMSYVRSEDWLPWK